MRDLLGVFDLDASEFLLACSIEHCRFTKIKTNMNKRENNHGDVLSSIETRTTLSFRVCLGRPHHGIYLLFKFLKSLINNLQSVKSRR